MAIELPHRVHGSYRSLIVLPATATRFRRRFAARKQAGGRRNYADLAPSLRRRKGVQHRRGSPASLIHVAENWADDEAVWPLPFPSGGNLKLLYSGNLGLSHYGETVLGGIATMNGDARFRFAFAGGARRDELRSAAACSLSDLLIRPRRSPVRALLRISQARDAVLRCPRPTKTQPEKTAFV
jgi:hypothetical protein